MEKLEIKYVYGDGEGFKFHQVKCCAIRMFFIVILQLLVYKVRIV